MTDIEKARLLFKESGLAFPTIPKELVTQLKEQGEWLFSTREIEVSPYNLKHYVAEISAKDYAIISHSGHSVNSYAIQYYIVYKSLRMFLHLSWGGTYTDAKKAASTIRDCISLADEIIAKVKTTSKLQDGDSITIVVSDSYGSYWLPNGKKLRDADVQKPAEMLAEVLTWLKNPQ